MQDLYIHQKKRNMILTVILTVIQVILCIISTAGVWMNIPMIYGLYAIMIMALAYPNIICLYLNLRFLSSGKYLYFTVFAKLLFFEKNPKTFIKETYPWISIVLLCLQFIIPTVLILK